MIDFLLSQSFNFLKVLRMLEIELNILTIIIGEDFQNNIFKKFPSFFLSKKLLRKKDFT